MEETIKEIDKTIIEICKCIQNETKSQIRSNMLLEMTTALARLVSARAEVKEVEHASTYKSSIEELGEWKSLVGDVTQEADC